MDRADATTWHVLPHNPVERLAENLWRVQGALPRMSLQRVMTLARMRSGQLVIHSAIALEDPLMREIEAFATPAFLIVPNLWHRLDAAAYKARYPKLRVLAPSGSRAKVQEVVQVDGGYEDLPADDDVKVEMLRGVKAREGVVTVRSADGVTVVLNDVVFNMDRKRDLLGFLFTTVLGSAPGPRISRLTKLVLIDDKKSLREDLERLAATPGLTRLIVAHEKVAHGPDARAALLAAARFL